MGEAEVIPALAKDSLPMDEVSRLSRAKEIGFNTEVPLYHGTGSNIEAFEKRNPIFDTDHNGFWFTSNPEQANTFAETTVTSKIPDNIQDKLNEHYHENYKFLPEEHPLHEENAIKQIIAHNVLERKTADELGLGGDNVIPAYLKMKNPYIIDMTHLGDDVAERTKILNKAKENGHDGVIFKNSEDYAGYRPDRPKGDVHVVFDPTQIRSKYAAFDPDKKTSSNISSFAPDISDNGVLDPLKIVGKGIEIADRFTGRPVRAAIDAALNKENPMDAVKSAILDKKDTSGKDVARSLLQKFEEQGMPLRPRGVDEYPLETPLGLFVDAALDPTSVMPVNRFKNLKKILK